MKTSDHIELFGKYLPGLFYIGIATPFFAISKFTELYYVSILGLALYLFCRCLEGDLKISRRFIVPFLIFCIFLIFATLSLTWTPEPSSSRYKLIDLVLIPSLLIITPQILLNEKRDLIKIFRILFFISLALSCSVSIIYLSQGRIRIFEIMGVGGHISLGRAIGVSVPISVYLYLNESSWEKRIGVGLSVVLLLISLLMIGSRAPFIAALLSSGLLIMITLLISKRIRLYHILALSALLFSIGIVFSSILTKLPGVKELAPILQGDLGNSAEFRLRSYNEALQIWSRSPILGDGLASFNTQFGTYPHNILFEVLAELGLVGALLLIMFILISFKGIFNNSKNPLNIILLSIFSFAFINSLLSSNLPGQRLLFFSIGMILSPSLSDHTAEG